MDFIIEKEIITPEKCIKNKEKLKVFWKRIECKTNSFIIDWKIWKYNNKTIIWISFILKCDWKEIIQIYLENWEKIYLENFNKKATYHWKEIKSILVWDNQFEIWLKWQRNKEYLYVNIK